MCFESKSESDVAEEPVAVEAPAEDTRTTIEQKIDIIRSVISSVSAEERAEFAEELELLSSEVSLDFASDEEPNEFGC